MPPFPVKNDTEVFLRQLVTGSIQDEERLEEAREQLNRIGRIRVDINYERRARQGTEAELAGSLA